MARLIGTLNEGSLLRRTVLHIGTLVLGSLTFITLVSALLVSVARSILPPHTSGESDGAAEASDGAELAATSRTAAGRAPRTKRPRGVPADGRSGHESAD